VNAVAGGLPPDLAAALERHWPRLKGFVAGVAFHDEIGSTNDEAMRLAAGGAPEGTVVIAARQDAGRGRQGRAWHSPAGAGLYLSVLLRPEISDRTAMLTLMAGVAAADAVERAAGLVVALKWPNDLVVLRAGGRRKLGGILAEASLAGTGPAHVVLGVGINLRRTALPADLAAIATSIETETGSAVQTGALAAELLASLAVGWRALRAGEAEEVLAEWRRRARPLLGQRVRWAGHGTAREGSARDIDGTGALIVDTPAGAEHVVAGEVTWL
jgi:BirA family biotin operon repressor/biotin-[acetyl-CoA-carboxylase] ligase